MNRETSRTVALVAVVLAAFGCEQTENPVAAGGAGDESVAIGPTAVETTATGAEARLNRELAQLRAATARFHRFEVADQAGYDILVTHPTSGAACLDHPTDGGMGRHYLKLGLVDDEVAVLDPEIVIYEPTKNGRLRLVGFEYIIPFTIRGPEETPPTLLGQEFKHNETFGLWMLHVYLWKNNPEGMFETWNPRITCEHDAAVE